MTEKEKKEEEIQAWLDQVHFGSCCSDEPEDCDPDKAASKDKKPSLSEPQEQAHSDSQ